MAQGVLRKGQEIEIRPGIVTKDAEGRAACIPIYSRIITLLAEQNELQYAVPGGLIGVGTTVSFSLHCIVFVAQNKEVSGVLLLCTHQAT